MPEVLRKWRLSSGLDKEAPRLIPADYRAYQLCTAVSPGVWYPKGIVTKRGNIVGASNFLKKLVPIELAGGVLAVYSVNINYILNHILTVQKMFS